MIAKSMSEAKTLGEKRYFTGKPCRRGHVVEKLTSGGCVECRRLRAVSPKYKARARKRLQIPEVRERRREQKRIRRADPGVYAQELDRDRIRHGIPRAIRPNPGWCESCGRFPKRTLAIDHCHKTGRFRGWLCSACNGGIGLLGDDLAGLLRAVEYLRKRTTPD